MKQNSQPENLQPEDSIKMPEPEMPEAKKSKAPLIGMISLGALAVAGVTFGIISLINANSKSAEIEELNAKVNLLQQETGTQIIEKDEDGTAITVVAPDLGNGTNPTGANSSDVNTEDYFYIGDWGIKIKKPENFINLVADYTFYNGYPQAVDDFTITLRNSNSAKITIYRQKTCTENSNNRNTIACLSVGNYSYVILQLVAGFEPAEPISEDLYNFFANVENYSEI